MKNITSLIICALSLIITPIYAQIITRNISKYPETYPGIKSVKNEKIKRFQMQAVDVKAELKKDSIERLRGILPRFGKSFETDIDFIKQASILSEKDSLYYIYHDRFQPDLLLPGLPGCFRTPAYCMPAESRRSCRRKRV